MAESIWGGVSRVTPDVLFRGSDASWRGCLRPSLLVSRVSGWLSLSHPPTCPHLALESSFQWGLEVGERISFAGLFCPFPSAPVCFGARFVERFS